MQKVAYNMKFVISDPTSRVQVDGRPNPNAKSYADAINKVLAEKKPQLIFVVIQNLTADIYQAVKKLTCVQNAIPSQVVLGKNISKNNMSVATKVVIQLNCKIGGAPWMVSYPLRNTMVSNSIRNTVKIAIYDHFLSSLFSLQDGRIRRDTRHKR